MAPTLRLQGAAAELRTLGCTHLVGRCVPIPTHLCSAGVVATHYGSSTVLTRDLTICCLPPATLSLQRANDEMRDWLIPVKPGDDETADPWEARANAKKERIVKNKLSHIRNLVRALPPGRVGGCWVPMGLCRRRS